MIRSPILIVDDDAVLTGLLSALLQAEGYNVRAVSNGDEAQAVLDADHSIRIVISDWEMPGMTGPALCRWLRQSRPTPYTNFILLTSRSGSDAVIEGLASGADEFLSKPVEPAELLLRIRTCERVLSLETRDALIFALAKLAESRDPETGLHLERTQRYCAMLADELHASGKHPQMDQEFVRLVSMTSPLHDIGKVGIPDFVLLKPSRLEPDEFEIMKRHTVIGAETLEAALCRSPEARFLQVARNIARSHHERWDGKGYPDGLRGETIPLEARIMSVADVYDALTSVRVYKSAMSHECAKAIIRDGAGAQFDPAIVEVFLRLESTMREVCATLQDTMDRSPSPREGPGVGSSIAYAKAA